MIKTFKCHETLKIWYGEYSRKLPNEIQPIARRKLRMLAAVTSIETLKVPPSNRLKKLKGKRNDQYSIRINDQWRICFEWIDGNSYSVEIIDYH